jgi:3-dehydro-L-gulonate 2-dehydrogenase
MRVLFADLVHELAAILVRRGFTRGRAELCARLFAETTRDGVYTHGVARFPRFLRMIANGSIDIHAVPTAVSAGGVLERWNGNRGPGNLNAHAAMSRAIDLAHGHGLGCVALSNTNHWMRGGTYGWQAAEAGLIGICWTNTLPNLPPWGSAKPVIGNNPLVIAVPRDSGHVVLDIAMSQYSYGALAAHRSRGESLPVDGGFDTAGNLTRDPAAIEASQRPLPIGYWKGSGLSLVLDLMAVLLSGGAATHQIPADPEREAGVCQIFLALGGPHPLNSNPISDAVIASLEGVRYPGENTLRLRAENLAQGVPIHEELWREIRSLDACSSN